MDIATVDDEGAFRIGGQCRSGQKGSMSQRWALRNSVVLHYPPSLSTPAMSTLAVLQFQPSRIESHTLAGIK